MSTPQLPITVITHHESRRVAAARIAFSIVAALIWLDLLAHHDLTWSALGFGGLSAYMAVHAVVLQAQMTWRKYRART